MQTAMETAVWRRAPRVGGMGAGREAKTLQTAAVNSRDLFTRTME